MERGSESIPEYELYQKNHNILDMALVKMMQRNWFICATQIEAMQPDNLACSLNEQV